MATNRKPNRGKDEASRLQTSRWAIVEAKRAAESSLLGGLVKGLKLLEVDGLDPLPAIGAADPAKGEIYLNPRFVGPKQQTLGADEWLFVLAHLALHLGLNHAARREGRDPWLWTLACDAAVDRLLASFCIGKRPRMLSGEPWPGDDPEEAIYEQMRQLRDLDRSMLPAHSLAGPGRPDLIGLGRPQPWHSDYEDRLAAGIQLAVQDTVTRAADSLLDEPAETTKRWAPAERAKRWVLSAFPLLGSLAGEVRIIADAELCERLDIPIAAVDGFLGEMYLHPNCGFVHEEMVFVYVHELLHVALFHHTRGIGRDHHIYNLAADFVINGWLVEMGVGRIPRIGALYDPTLQGKSVEEVYDLLVRDPKTCKRLRGFRGGRGDVLTEAANGQRIHRGDVTTLDDIYRRCLREGFACQCGIGRGFVPAALMEEIQSLWTAPVDWDVELAQWMDRHVAVPRDWRRTYARASRRQASTPDIPRPARYMPPEAVASCTFGVLLDTSGSMDRHLLGRALGAIASYADARDVQSVRLVLCDAAPYDLGYVAPADLRGIVAIQGRGGTVLQPGLAHLLRQTDFPPKAPIMILTDGWCEEEIVCPREHCFVLPRKSWNEGAMPLRTSAPVFRVLKRPGDPA